MNKRFYHFAIFFTILSVVANVFQSTVGMLLGPRIISLESFPIWYVLVNAIILTSGIYMLKYLHNCKYSRAFFAGTLAILASIFHGTLVYFIVVSGEFREYFMSTLLVSLGAGMLYGISLIFSRAGKRFWLKIAGVSIFIIGLFMVAVLIWGVYVPEEFLNGNIDKILQQASLIGSLIPVLYILNFFDELKVVKKADGFMSQNRIQETSMAIVAMLALCTTLVMGVLMGTEAGSVLYWQKRNAEKTQALVNKSESRIYVSSAGDTLQYLLLKPIHYDSVIFANNSMIYPLLINLPYGAYEGAEVAQILSDDYYRKAFPSFLFVPYCPQGSGWGGIPDHLDIDILVFEAIRSLDQEFAIDTNRRYVTGISRGGYGSWHFITSRPEMFAAAIPVCGAGDPQLAPDIVNVAVWAFHGENDRNVPVSGSRDMIEGIKRAGGNPQYTEFKGQGHNIWYQVRTTPGLIEWLFSQKRE